MARRCQELQAITRELFDFHLGQWPDWEQKAIRVVRQVAEAATEDETTAAIAASATRESCH